MDSEIKNAANYFHEKNYDRKLSPKHTHTHTNTHMYAVSSTIPSAPVEFLDLVLEKRRLLGYANTNEGELAAFISYAQAFPTGLMALVDTYDTVQRLVEWGEVGCRLETVIVVTFV